MLISLDLSTSKTGVAKFSDDGKLLEYFSIVPDYKLHPYLRIKFIVEELQKHFLETNHCVIEGIFLGIFGMSGASQVVGFETLARLSGAVVNSWLSKYAEIPVLLKATEARALVGVKGNCQKADVQYWVCQKYNYATQEQLDTFVGMIEAEIGAFKEKEFTKATFKKHMDQISKYIEGETGLGEDCSDAILLGNAYFEAMKRGRT
jgi:hypothetical protein